MLNHKLFTVLGFVLFSSFAFADPTPKPQPTATPKPAVGFDFECSFRGSQARKGQERLKCWVRGFGCNDEQQEECENVDKPLKIKCNNGFHLDSEDAADELEGKTLWFNAEDQRTIATLRIQEFLQGDLKIASVDEFTRDADLLVSDTRHWADRLDGSCRIKERKKDSTVH